MVPQSGAEEMAAREDTSIGVAPTASPSPAGCAPETSVDSGMLLSSGGLEERRQLLSLGDEKGIEQDIVFATGGEGHVLALTTDGTVLAWGANERGQSGTEDGGDGRLPYVETPRPVVAPDGSVGHLNDVVQLSADSTVSMARRGDGTVVVWGSNDAGQHGRGTRDESRIPRSVLDEGGSAPLVGASDIAADGRTLFAVVGSHVLAWGANSDGQLGDGTVTSRPVPKRVVGLQGKGRLSDVVDVAAGGQHGIALLRSGRVVTWGSNERGQLGDGTLSSRVVPGLVYAKHNVPLEGVVAVAASELNSYALLDSGAVMSWGNGEGGQLGNGQRDAYSEFPTEVEGGRSLKATCVAPGEAFVAVLRQDGSVVTWGSGGRGQLAAGEERGRLQPGPALNANGAPVSHVHSIGAGERQLFVTTAQR